MHDPIIPSARDQLCAAVAARGLSSAEVAELSGVPLRTVQDLLSAPAPATVDAIAAALGIELRAPDVREVLHPAGYAARWLAAWRASPQGPMPPVSKATAYRILGGQRCAPDKLAALGRALGAPAEEVAEAGAACAAWLAQPLAAWSARAAEHHAATVRAG